MNKITFPLRQGMKGVAITGLHDALKLCLDRGLILADDPAARKAAEAALKTDRSQKSYGVATARLVIEFQKVRGLPATGIVDDATASALNDWLRASGVLTATDGSEVAALDSRYTL